MCTLPEANHLAAFLFQEGIKLNEGLIVVVKPVIFPWLRLNPSSKGKLLEWAELLKKFAW